MGGDDQDAPKLDDHVEGCHKAASADVLAVVPQGGRERRRSPDRNEDWWTTTQPKCMSAYARRSYLSPSRQLSDAEDVVQETFLRFHQASSIRPLLMRRMEP
jgi:hypothetical protein